MNRDLTQDDALAQTGATIGAVLAALTWTQDSDIRITVEAALKLVQWLSEANHAPPVTWKITHSSPLGTIRC